MKKIALLLLLLPIFVGCGTRRDHVNDDETELISDVELDDQLDDLNETPVMDDKGAITTTGIVRDKSAENCGFLIEIEIEGEPKLFEPLPLAEEFQVDNLPVKVTYRVSRRPSNCLLSIPIILDKIERF